HLCLRLLPCLPTVVAHVYLAALRAAVHTFWCGAVDGDLRHAAQRCVPDIDALPGRACITATEQRAGLLRSCWGTPTASAGRQIDDFGVVWGHQEATAVGATGEHLVDLDVFPMLGTVT